MDIDINTFDPWPRWPVLLPSSA